MKVLSAFVLLATCGLLMASGQPVVSDSIQHAKLRVYWSDDSAGGDQISMRYYQLGPSRTYGFSNVSESDWKPIPSESPARRAAESAWIECFTMTGHLEIKRDAQGEWDWYDNLEYWTPQSVASEVWAMELLGTFGWELAGVQSRVHASGGVEREFYFSRPARRGL